MIVGAIAFASERLALVVSWPEGANCRPDRTLYPELKGGRNVFQAEKETHWLDQAWYIGKLDAAGADFMFQTPLVNP
ncbi:hypothetical protein M405DRAFT_201319 [Rhizopogon salebrosus TDB-379]|nr:hypothetical protein M405DRAFT_201319 [Rhizopogon salebrosus TDB-379]